MCYILQMTKLLEQAIAKVRELPEEDQDALAVTILALAEADESVAPLDDETRAAILEGLDQARRGEFVSDEEIAALLEASRTMRVRFTSRARNDLLNFSTTSTNAARKALATSSARFTRRLN
jgi:predicted transcriptional regulator